MSSFRRVSSVIGLAGVIACATPFAGVMPPNAVHAQAAAPALTPATADFTAFLATVDAAQLELQNGRPAPFKALWSHADDITLSGGFGGAIEKGWNAKGLPGNHDFPARGRIVADGPSAGGFADDKTAVRAAAELLTSFSLHAAANLLAVTRRFDAQSKVQ